MEMLIVSYTTFLPRNHVFVVFDVAKFRCIVIREQIHISYTLPPLIPSIPRPPMIPPLPPRKIRLQPCILHRHTPPNSPLNHRTAIQPTHILSSLSNRARIRPLPTRLALIHAISVAVHEPQVLAGRAHRHVLALELELLGGAALAQKEEPGAVDGPVAEGAVAGEMEGARG